MTTSISSPTIVACEHTNIILVCSALARATIVGPPMIATSHRYIGLVTHTSI